MCLSCDKYGHGDKWYLNPDAFTRDSWEASGAGEFFQGWIYNWEKQKVFYERMKKIKDHMASQILPLEDALQVVELAATMAEVDKGWFEIHPCPCITFVTGKKDFRCMGFGVTIDYTLKAGRNPRVISKEEYEGFLKTFDRKGLVHKLRSIGGPNDTMVASTFCNCQTDYCTELRGRQVWDLKEAFLKAHHVALVDSGKCTGCTLCVSWCQFGAISMSRTALGPQAIIDPTACFGCGLCRNGCKFDAIAMEDRENVAVAKNLW